MPRKILATVVEVHCPTCGKPINLRSESGQPDQYVSCWNCGLQHHLHNGYGVNNLWVEAGEKRIRYTIIWQDKP